MSNTVMGRTASETLRPASIGQHPWTEYSESYRAKEIASLVRWIVTGASGSIIGLNGSGKSDLLGFLCYRPDALQQYWPEQAPSATVLPVDLNNLPSNTLAALFRVILRTFYEHRTRFDSATQELISRLYLENRAATDPFLSQSALRELLLDFQQRRHRVVFALDRFDLFCRMLTPEMSDALRGLRDSFKDTLSYIASMRLGLAYLPEPDLLGNLLRLLDQHICYVGPMNEDDTVDTIGRRTALAAAPPTADEVAQIRHLTGGYPALVMFVCRWWQNQVTRMPLDAWQELLLREVGVRHRLEDIWESLTQEEQVVLTEIQKSTLLGRTANQRMGDRYADVLRNLAERGLCVQVDDEWQIFSGLFAAYVAAVGGVSRGKIWFNEEAQTLYYGEEILTDLTPKEQAILQFLVQEPRTNHTYTDIIVAAWSDEERYNGVSTENLQQVIRTLRVKIEPNPSHPVYIVTWRNKPEGGYIFFPEGRPR
ncbi:MAG: helix-turn-helix domain-containing protein [Caldilineaceae bacterium]